MRFPLLVCSLAFACSDASTPAPPASADRPTPASAGAVPTDVPSPDAPSPDAPSPDVPTAETSTADASAPATPTAEAPTPDAPSGDSWADEAWIEDAVTDALANEIMPGTSGEPEPGRQEALRTFFAAHPEYRDAEKRAPLWEHACGLGGIEEAHAYITQPPPKKALELEVSEDDWRIFVAHADVHCTSDDWGYYTYEASEAAEMARAVTGYGNADMDTLVVRAQGKELLRMPLSGQGYIVARAGQEPTALAYDPSVAGSVTAYFKESGQRTK